MFLPILLVSPIKMLTEAYTASAFVDQHRSNHLEYRPFSRSRILLIIVVMLCFGFCKLLSRICSILCFMASRFNSDPRESSSTTTNKGVKEEGEAERGAK